VKQDPAGTLQPLVQRLPVDLSSLQQVVEGPLLFDREVGVFIEVERQTADFAFSDVNEPFVVEKMVGETDPRRIPGAVAALGKDEQNLCLGQDRLILLRDNTPIEDKGRPGGLDLGRDPTRVVTSLTEPGRARSITGRPASVALKSAMLTCGNQTPSAL